MHGLYTMIMVSQEVTEEMDRKFNRKDIDGLAQYGIWDEIGSRESLVSKISRWWITRSGNEVAMPKSEAGLSAGSCGTASCVPQT